MSSGKKKICSVLANLKLVHGKEEVDKKEVCKLAGIPVATAPSLLCRMTKEGLIMKGKTTGCIAITDKGLTLLETINKTGRTHKILDKLTEEEAIQLSSLLDKIR